MKNFHMLLPVLLTLVASPVIAQPTQQELLDRIQSNRERDEQQFLREDRARWGKCYGIWQYDSQWRLSNGKEWTAVRTCWRRLDNSPSKPSVALEVDCKNLKVKTFALLKIRHDTRFIKWRNPTEGEQEAVAARCSDPNR